MYEQESQLLEEVAESARKAIEAGKMAKERKGDTPLGIDSKRRHSERPVGPWIDAASN